MNAKFLALVAVLGMTIIPSWGFKYESPFYPDLPAMNPIRMAVDQYPSLGVEPLNLPVNFTWGNAYLKMLLAYSSYCEPKALIPWNCYWCKYSGHGPSVKITKFLWGNATNSFGWIGYDNSSIYLSFRGTKGVNWANWMTDLNFPQITPYKNSTALEGAFVHRGFAQVYQSVAGTTMENMLELKKRYPEKNIVIVGHSLGAAIGALAAVDLSIQYNITDMEMWSFGMPRVGNTVFSNYLQKWIPSWRLTNKRDPIPHLPPNLFGFQQITREVWFSSPKNYTMCSSTNGEDSTCSNSVWYYTIDDHRTYLGLRQNEGGLYGC